jgi:DNA polymerase-1
MSPKKELYLIDGHALAYRAYYATIRTPLTNSKGKATGAVFGFANTLVSLLKEYACPYLAVVFDSTAPTFRKQMYAQYKAHRPEMPDDLKSQIPLIFELVKCFNIPTLIQDGLEADDILAYLSRKAAAQGFHVWLVTKDKDLMQLVCDQVTMLAPEPGGKLVAMGPAEVEAKLGVPPDKILDLLALMGDSSDNIPGVPGIGPKTAIKILQEAGSVEQLLRDPSCVTNEKWRQKIIDNRQDLELSRVLATLKCDTANAVDIESLAGRVPDREKCNSFFTEMEFQSLLRNPLFEKREATRFSVSVPQTLDEVKMIAAAIVAAGRVSIDTETTSIEPRQARLVGISLALDEERAWYLPVGHVADEAPSAFSTDSAASALRNLPLDEVLAALKPVIESAEIAKIGQNLKYDYQVFKGYNLNLRGISFDTMIAAYLIDPGKRQFNLDTLAEQWLELKTIPIESLIGKGKEQRSFAAVDIQAAANYSGEDAVLPLRLMAKFRPILEERDLLSLFRGMEMPLVSVLAEIEWRGIMIDAALLAELSKEHGAQLQTIVREIYAMAGESFNLNSPKQIADLFFGKLGMPVSRKTKTGLSTDVDALEKLATDFPIAGKLLEHRELQKLLSTYIDALPLQVNPTTKRLHSSFNQTVTATGRLSSTNPNLQNIPVRTEVGRRIREAFIAPPGYVILSADYSQIELRILAHLSKDPQLVEAFMQEMDIHIQTASIIYGIFPQMVSPQMRRVAKTINFGLMYGMGPINLSRQLGISFKEAQAFINTYFQQFPSIHNFMDECIAKARANGYSETMFGRRRYLPEINAQNRQVREAAERTAINTPVQGAAADIIKIAMVNINREIGNIFPDSFLLLQVHDELVFEVPRRKAEEVSGWVQTMMTGACELAVPLKVDVGHGENWSQAH